MELETSVTNCQTAINQNKGRCEVEYEAEAKAEAEARAKANGMTKAQVIAKAKAEAEARLQKKAKAKAKAKVENKAEAKVEINDGKATRHAGWCGGMMDGRSLPTMFFPRGFSFHSNDKLVMWGPQFWSGVGTSRVNWYSTGWEFRDWNLLQAQAVQNLHIHQLHKKVYLHISFLLL